MGAVRLASLALEGFKSFATRVELSFPGAIIAIVGPNGAGKSNIADALAWVLGEQSARLLRSQNMADVIFTGSPRRGPAGSAFVSMRLASTDGRWTVGDGLLELSRRVMRDGTSEYRLGGKRARLKDVVDALMDAGLGTRAYAIIEQGRIGQVLSVRATERRNLFEEAAGITKFRARRHEAELKLAETRANLLRLADVASEVRRALEGARRQARRAEKHQQLRHRLVEVKATLFASRRIGLLATLGEREQAVTAAHGREVEAATSLAAAEAGLAELRRELDGAQDQLVAVRDEQARADAAAQRREAEEGAARRERDEAIARREQALAEAARLDAAATIQSQRESELQAAVGAAQGTLAEQEEGAAGAAAKELATGATAKQAVSRAEEARRALLQAASAATEARNRGHRLEVELEQATYQRGRVGAEHERLATHLAQVVRNEEEAATKETAASTRQAEADAARQELRARHEALTARSTELTATRDRVGHQRWQAKHEREGLERLLASARALPQVLARAVPAEKVLGTVADFLDPETAVARHLDAAYGELLSVPVLADKHALTALAAKAPATEGRVEVVVAERSLPARPSPLLEHAGAKQVDLGWLSRALPRAAVAETLDEAERLAAEDADLVVLLPGGGRRRGTRVELPGKTAATAGVLELRIKHREVSALEAETARREEELVTELDSVRAQLGETAQSLASSDGAVQTAAETLAAAASVRQSLQRERGRLERELEALVSETERLANECQSLGERVTAARAETERLGKRSSDVEAEVDALAREAERERDAASLARTEAERMRGAVAVARERLAAAQRELERHAQEIADLRARETQARGEADSGQQRADQAGRTAVEARADLEQLLGKRAAFAREVEAHTTHAEALRERVAAAAGVTETARTTHLTAKDGAHACELALAETHSAWERLEEAIGLTLGPGVELPSAAPAPEQLPALEEEEQALSKELEALGPVNELAVAERDELETRHKFLGVQRRDLERSLETLGQTVVELDQTCAERFLATLEEANVAFDLMFRELFGGGEARAELSDPDAPLESGIEIRVRPPGKHTQSVLLLSGGEKALAAVALLLALFKIRPAPFCLLDEVDAPLDDANVERLCRLLREMSTDTQFLLITHNRRTMAHADVLYGVTMEEPGVSRIVSVRLEE
jgi:chromosome segregation protein